MTDATDFAAGKQPRGRGRGRPFRRGESGNPRGKAAGTRSRAIRLLDQLGEQHSEALVKRAVELALGGDTAALGLLLRRVWPERRGAPVAIQIPELRGPEDLAAALGGVAQAVAGGAISPEEGASVAAVLEGHRRALETVELERRLAALEARSGVA